LLIDNIIQQVDDRQQDYRIILCKMNREVIREITSQSYSKTYSPQLGGVESFAFTIPKYYDNKEVANYDDIIGRNLVRIQKGDTNIGYFEIQNPQIVNDGMSEKKNVKVYAEEIKLIGKKVYLTEGVFKIQDDINPENGILNLVTSISKSWDIGYVDPALVNKERYFDIADTNIYELLMNQTQTTFECVFIYDTTNKLINVYALENFGNESKIIMSLDNILETASVEEISDEIVTRLHLYGDNEITVRDINFGNDYIQNFSYFKNTKFMSQSLIDVLDDYDVLQDSYSATYTNYLASLSVLEGDLVDANSDLLILEGELTSLQEQKSLLISIGGDIAAINIEIANKQSDINLKENEINSLQNSIDSINNSIDTIINILNESNNFTEEQLKELDLFIIADTYQDSSFLVTDNFTYNESIAIQEDLLELGASILQRVSVPRYKINISAVDFLRNKEYAPWWDELKIGDTVLINVDNAFTATVRVTSYNHSEDNNGLDIQLGDKYQLDDPNIELLDLIKSSLSTSTSVNYERYKYKDYVNNNKNEVLEFINSSLDLNKNKVIGGEHQELLFDPSGALFRRWNENANDYSNKQLKIVNNAIVLTDDKFLSAKTAIGELANGLYGIAAEIIAGKMILGNNLIIETNDGSFKVDENGVNITSMVMNLTTDDNLKNILIDPEVGFKIRSRSNTSQAFVDTLFIDPTSKKLNFDGDITARSLTIISGSGIANLSDAGGLATRNNVDMSTTDIINKTADYIEESINRKWAGESGADITGSNISAGFANQGMLSLLDSINGTYIDDNSITTPKILAGSVTSSKISVGELSAIVANLGTVTAGSITGVTITGGKIRTSTSGKRIQIANDDLNTYNASNQKHGVQIEADKSFNALDFYEDDILSSTLQLTPGLLALSTFNIGDKLWIATDSELQLSANTGNIVAIANSGYIDLDSPDVRINGVSIDRYDAIAGNGIDVSYATSGQTIDIDPSEVAGYGLEEVSSKFAVDRDNVCTSHYSNSAPRVDYSSNYIVFRDQSGNTVGTLYFPTNGTISE